MIKEKEQKQLVIKVAWPSMLAPIIKSSSILAQKLNFESLKN